MTSMEQIRIEKMFGNIHLGTNGGNLALQTLQIDEEDKKWLNDIAQAVSVASGNKKYGASTVGREAISFYRQLYPVAHKLLSVAPKLVKYIDAVVAFLSKLP